MTRQTLSLLVIAAGCSLPAVAQAPAKETLDRGRYLVEEVAKCQDCHSPRGDNGELDRTRWMKGAVLDFAPLQPVPNWHKTSPDLTGKSRLFERWGEKALVEFMKTGLNPKGHPADPPMPAYKLTPADAEAVVAFLKSLP
jgi:mono/diheme cytochrome c family protein